jgi:hypothetical protein
MSWSITLNVVFGAVIVIMALDRFYWRKMCALRHNPIDQAIEEIKKDVKAIFRKLDDLTQHIFTKE